MQPLVSCLQKEMSVGSQWMFILPITLEHFLTASVILCMVEYKEGMDQFAHHMVTERSAALWEKGSRTHTV